MKKCPQCTLENPDERTWCLCGYEFPEVARADSLSEVPWTIWVFVALTGLGIAHRLYRYLDLHTVGYAWDALGGEIRTRMIGTLVWAFITTALVVAMLSRKNWARVVLVIWTFPLGLIFALSKAARGYTQPTARLAGAEDGEGILRIRGRV